MLQKIPQLIKCLPVLFILFAATGAKAQTDEAENEYYKSFAEQLTVRYYFSRKYTALRIRDREERQLYTYRPNTTLNMGIGATYKWATLNLAYGFGFLNRDIGQGDTRYLDLQAHAYPRKMVVDLFGQFYKGYYLAPAGRAAAPEERYYVRPDLKVTKLGASAQYVFNHDRFSYRAAFVQNEWQQKSAGTFLLGFEFYGGKAEADSALAPAALLQNDSRNFDGMRFLEFGPNAGYAYTLVVKRHLFFTASAAANLGVGYTSLERDTHTATEWGAGTNFFLRGVVGYNAERWSVSANYVHNNVRLARTQGFANATMTGNYRLNFVYRFLPGPKLNRYLRHLDRQ